MMMVFAGSHSSSVLEAARLDAHLIYSSIFSVAVTERNTGDKRG